MLDKIYGNIREEFRQIDDRLLNGLLPSILIVTFYEMFFAYDGLQM
jgi:hypothetical protein